jgi:hypothetical protein
MTMNKITWSWAGLAATAVLLGCGDDSSGTTVIPDASLVDAGRDAAIVVDATAPDAADVTAANDADATLPVLEAGADEAATDAGGPDAPADAGNDGATACNANNCGGACCGDLCVPRTCAACDAGTFFCPYFATLLDSNGTCVSSCLACGTANLDAGDCE